MASDREVEYYKRRLDELGGETVRLDYEISGLRKEVKQKRQAFTLLSRLQRTIGAENDLEEIFGLVLREVNATLGMDRTIVLTPTDRAGYFRPTQWTGFTEEGRVQELEQRFSSTVVEFPADWDGGRGFLLATKESEETGLVQILRNQLELPFFVLVPVRVERVIVGLLVSGRIKEGGTVFPPLDLGDVETFQAIAGLISASVENTRIRVLRETDRLKTEFFANLSHEFRTPITLTIGPLEGILAGRYGEVSERIRDQARVMKRSQARLLDLVTQVLNLAKLEAGRLTLRASPLPDVHSFVEERIAPFRTVCEARGLELRLRLEGDATSGQPLYVDRRRLDELLTNLVSNAIKFTPNGWVEVSTTERDGAFVLAVRDSGVGIRASELPHIFDRFRQADGSVSREYAGTGIGLAWVKAIAELHGGSVVAYSEYGKGSSFEVRIPFGSSHLDPSSVIEYTEDDLPPLSGPSRLYIVSEGASDRDGVEAANLDAEKKRDPTRPTVLYAEDNPDLRRYIRDLLEEQDRYNVFLAGDGRDALEKARAVAPDLLLLDQMMPRMSGIEVLREVRRDAKLRDVPVLFLTARAGSEARIDCLADGADDYVTKPFEADELLARIQNLLRLRAQTKELRELNLQLEAQLEDQMAALVRKGEVKRVLPTAVVENVVSRNPRMQQVLAMTRRIADSSATVLIRGETGTGKEVIARSIHRQSPYRGGPFVPVHCAALPATLLESELFGHEKGAFTGATSRREGRFELAHGGTLFLDEVGETGPEVQVKLLRVLQERRFERLGGKETLQVDVRIVAATNRDLEEEIRRGTFREDLYFRLNVVPVLLPPLRERREDVPFLITHFLERYRRQLGRGDIVVSDEAMDLLLAYRWPGNVRELQNLVERMVVIVDGTTILPSHLPPEVSGTSLALPKPTAPVSSLEDMERQHIEAVLKETGGVIRGARGAAALLGVPESTLRYRLKKLGIERSLRNSSRALRGSSRSVQL